MNEVGIVALVGFMGCGKSTVGLLLSRELGKKFVDLDTLIEEKEGRSIATIFDEQGEREFRNLESKWLNHLLRNELSLVLACGGGLFTREENRVRLEGAGAISLWLNVGLPAIRSRMSRHDMLRRPLMRDWALVQSLYEERRPFYEMANAEFLIDDGEGVQEVVNRVLSFLKRRNG